MVQTQDALPVPQQQQAQTQPMTMAMAMPTPHSPVASTRIDSFLTASPMSASETSAPNAPNTNANATPNHRLTDNDLLGMSVPTDRMFDDDTAPSSSDETPLYNVEGNVPDEHDGIYDDAQLRPLIYGYLEKMGRNGKWQKRFFETDGESLSYYKNEKRTKQLATLDLMKVRKSNQFILAFSLLGHDHLL